MLQSTENRFDVLIDSYLENTIGIDPAFLSGPLCEGLHQRLMVLRQNDALHGAGIGNEVTKDQTQTRRSDNIFWLDKKHRDIFETAFLEQIEDLIVYLNRTCYAGINAYEFHFALYESGSFYGRHKDQFKNDDSRKFSLITYLNEDWQVEEGGQLLVYPEGEVQAILPVAKKSVFFKSAEMDHEVMPASRHRMSITGWLKRI